MGYFTSFRGSFKFDRPLLPRHADYIRKFASTRHVKRLPKLLGGVPDAEREAVDLPLGDEGEYFVNGGEARDASVLNDAEPPGKQPSLYCGWMLSEDERHLIWDEGDKFYGYVEWLEYLIERFFTPWEYILNGKVHWEGEDPNDRGTIVVRKNSVDIVRPKVSETEKKAYLAQREVVARELDLIARAVAAADGSTDRGGGDSGSERKKTFESEQDAIFSSTLEAIRPDLNSVNTQNRENALAAIKQLGLEAKRVTVPILQDYVKREMDAALRAEAACLLGEIASDDSFSIPLLVEALQDKRANIRERAALGLAFNQKKAEVATPLLLSLFQDKKWSVRHAALTALGKVAPAGVAISSGVAALSDDEVSVRRCAISVLEDRGANSSEAIAALKRCKSNGELVSEIERALSALGASDLPASLDELIIILTENAPARREAAFSEIKARAENSDAVVQRLAEMLEAPVKGRELSTRAAWALGRLGSISRNAIPALASALESDDEDLAYASALALTHIGAEAKSAEIALRKATKSKFKSVRFQSERALKAVLGPIPH